MDGRARAPAAGTILNALATGVGSAFAIDLETTATVRLADDGEISGTIRDRPDADPALVERCAERVVDRYGDGEGVRVETESEVPSAAGLKSSSAAANAAVVATLDALGYRIGDDTTTTDGKAVDRREASRIGVEAARDVGVTITGAFDDASASMLGGVTVTDNEADALLAHESLETSVLVWTPPHRAFSADADVDACERIAPVADHVADLALDGHYGLAMTLNGLAFAAALGYSTDPMLQALPDVEGVSLSGTGPSVVAIGERGSLASVRDAWAEREGSTRLIETRKDGTRIA
ncbi:MAG: shikimate kinase [Halobacteriales archaeon]|jgi:shikimate kinase